MSDIFEYHFTCVIAEDHIQCVITVCTFMLAALYVTYRHFNKIHELNHMLTLFGCFQLFVCLNSAFCMCKQNEKS